ncbi:hypothetical protein, partial [Hallella multisaccharivorax]|uniref:hypothetical protein n=1 Tax=Hallella multisaccharivorax TaxID=310514 RepID=UPI001CC819DB
MGARKLERKRNEREKDKNNPPFEGGGGESVSVKKTNFYAVYTIRYTIKNLYYYDRYNRVDYNLIF